jgi:hypothetical protein
VLAIPHAVLAAAADAVRDGLQAVAVRMSEHSARQLVYARSGRVCERCGRSRAHDWHHRQNRSQGGLWCPSNGLHLCRSCHEDIGRYPAHAMGGGWLLDSHATPANAPVRLHLHGWALLNTDGSVHPLTRGPIF